MQTSPIALPPLFTANQEGEERTFNAVHRRVAIYPDARPEVALYEGLRATIEFLNENRIEYWLVRPSAGIRFTLGVRKSDRKRMLDALIARREFSYIRRVHPRPRVASEPWDTVTGKYPSLLEDATVLRLVTLVAQSGNERYFGEEFSTEIEFWDDRNTNTALLFEDEREAPRPGATTRRIRESEGIESIPLSRLTRLQPRIFDDIFVDVPRSQATLLPEEINFPIDAVFTWVDGNDEQWIEQKREYDPRTPVHLESNSSARYANREELRFALRSLRENAPWLRNVYIVTANQRPTWFRESARVKIISHEDIFSQPEHLPTFNSHAIEAQLHRIPGLAEHFIYFNDDMFLGRTVTPNHFYFGNGAAKHFLSPSRVPHFSKDPLDTPVDQAVKNSRSLLKRQFGREQSQVMEHAPYALVKSVISDLEQHYPDEFDQTAASRFRSADDLNIPSHLAHHWGYQMRLSFPSNGIKFTYIGLGRHDLAMRLDRLLSRRDSHAFCLNDTIVDGGQPFDQDLLARFFAAYFPTPTDSELH